ncbi:MAG TPA: NAD-dependent succinate-semialdehyde dehydrogenase [Bacteroidota bacterium]|nr:NAD-dependent succinate-semialdehyde dehydrogenase [Bacteroidota bacterium]
MAIQSLNPATGELLKQFQPISESEIEKKLDRADQTFRAYRRTTFSERAQKMMQVAGILETEKIELGKLMTTEMGKTLRSAAEEAVKCAWGCRFYAENAERFLADEVVQSGASLSYIRYEPLGPILAIMPWNFPFWQVFRFAAAALMAGNVALLKHAPNVPQCALKISEIFHRAGFPEGAFQTLLIEVDAVKRILEDRRVKAVTLTGSVRAGGEVAALAGSALKKTVLELGGSDAFIVMPSADLDQAVKTGVTARTINNGQSCIAAKRFILHEQVADDFTKRFVAAMEALRVGDPMNNDTDIGPITRADLLAKLDEQVQESVKLGAKVLTGAKILKRPGYFYAPTVLTDIPKDSPAYDEELFGPVASLFQVRNIEEAITVANDTMFGLGSAAWTRDRAEMKKFIDELEAGLVFINAMVASDPRLPFGGVKQSGYGRELGVQGIREFVNVKTVWIKGS